MNEGLLLYNLSYEININKAINSASTNYTRDKIDSRMNSITMFLHGMHHLRPWTRLYRRCPIKPTLTDVPRRNFILSSYFLWHQLMLPNERNSVNRNACYIRNKIKIGELNPSHAATMIHIHLTQNKWSSTSAEFSTMKIQNAFLKCLRLHNKQLNLYW